MRKEIALLIGAAAIAGCGFEGHFAFGDGIQGSGVTKSETRKVESFEGIELAGSPTVVWKKGNEHTVRVTCDDNLLPLLKTAVEGGSLKIGFEKSVHTKTDCRIEIVSPEVRSAAISGSGSIEISGVQVKAFVATVSGSGTLNLSGSTDSAELNVTGSGTIDASRFAAGTAKASTTGSGTIELLSTGSVTATVTGSGSIGVAGTQNVVRNITGSGEVLLR